MSLKNYRKKRDFDSTKEPEVSGEKIEKNVFVVQKHDAKKLHYDIRLEIGGLLKSWAIPKGPSLDPSMKRLAIPTEDHPIEYLDFEGKIPKGSYGAGFVIVWDKGKYENRTFKDQKKLSMKNAYKNGHITVLLKGQKLKGEFSFIKLEGKINGC